MMALPQVLLKSPSGVPQLLMVARAGGHVRLCVPRCGTDVLVQLVMDPALADQLVYVSEPGSQFR